MNKKDIIQLAARLGKKAETESLEGKGDILCLLSELHVFERLCAYSSYHFKMIIKEEFKITEKKILEYLGEE